MRFNPGFNIEYDTSKMTYVYHQNCFGPKLEIRKLDDIRHILIDPYCEGPSSVYVIAMDVGDIKDRQDLLSKNLLYGTVMYARGRIGNEPVHSQGHIHAISKSCAYSTPEVYEIWAGKAYILMQELITDDPGCCFAVEAKAGDVVVVPPGWPHATISADYNEPLVFGAWCVRDYGFVYEDVRRHHGLAFYALYDENDKLVFKKNRAYINQELIIKKPRVYHELEIELGMSIYLQYQNNPDRFMFVSKPQLKLDVWQKFIP